MSCPKCDAIIDGLIAREHITSMCNVRRINEHSVSINPACGDHHTTKRYYDLICPACHGTLGELLGADQVRILTDAYCTYPTDRCINCRNPS